MVKQFGEESLLGKILYLTMIMVLVSAIVTIISLAVKNVIDPVSTLSPHQLVSELNHKGYSMVIIDNKTKDLDGKTFEITFKEIEDDEK